MFSMMVLADIFGPDPVEATPVPVVIAKAVRKPVSAPILLPHANGYVEVTLPDNVDPGADEQYADLRIYDEHETEIPYVLDAKAKTSGNTDGALLEQSTVPQHYVEAIVDSGPQGIDHQELSLDADADEFYARVSVETSDDRNVWRRLRDDGLIYRITGDHPAQNLAVSFSQTRSRFFRLRMYTPRTDMRITLVQFSTQAGENVKLSPRHVQLTRTDSTKTQATEFIATPPHRHDFISEIRFSHASAFFSRHVTVEASSDGQAWSSVTEGDITHFAHGEDQLSLDIPPQYAKYWRVRIFNGNDAPLRGVTPALCGAEHTIVMRADAPHTYHAEWGSELPEPVYDLSTRLDHEDWHLSGRGTIEALVAAPGLRPNPLLEFAARPAVQEWALRCITVLGTCFLLAWTWRIIRAKHE